MSNKRITRGEKIFYNVNEILVIVISLIFLIPFFIVVMTSFVSENEIALRGSFILIPKDFDLGAYKMLFAGNSALFKAYGITILRVVVGTFFQILLTACMAYPMSKDDLPGSKFAITLVTVAMVFPVGLIPQFLLVKNLGLIDSFWSMVIPFVINSYNLFIMKAFFKQVPVALEESATIDGCNELQTFIRIVLPLSLPSIATIGLFYAVWNWNEWFFASIFINDPSGRPVQNLMQGILMQASSADLNSQFSETMNQAPVESLKSAMIVVTTLPILCVYPFVQKYFVKGMMIGSVKG